MNIVEEEPQYCQTHQPNVAIPALTFESSKALGKASRWTFISPVPCTMAGCAPFKAFLTRLSSKPPALVTPPFHTSPSQHLIPALLYPHSSKSPLLAFKLLMTCPIHRETCVPPLLAEAFYIIAGSYATSLRSVDQTILPALPHRPCFVTF